MSKKEKLIELDYVRVVAMLGVITIHVTSTFVYAQSNVMLGGMNLAFFLNQLARFAVPLFILLSGMSLGFSRTNVSYKSFIKSRCVKILAPYLFWSVVYWFLYHRGESVSSFVKSLFFGSSAPHMYFIVIIFQLYLLYPILKRAVTRYPAPSLIAAFVISLVSQQAILYSGNGLIQSGLPARIHLWELFPTWIFYFVLGLLIYEAGIAKLCQWGSKNFYFLIAVTAVYGVWFSCESYLTQSLDSVKPQLFLFTPVILLTFLAIGGRLRNVSGLNKVISFLANRSQTVYFSHILILTCLRKIPALTTGMRGMLLLLLLEILLSVVFAWCLDFLIHKARKLIKMAHRGPSPVP